MMSCAGVCSMVPPLVALVAGTLRLLAGWLDPGIVWLGCLHLKALAHGRHAHPACLEQPLLFPPGDVHHACEIVAGKHLL